MKMLTEITKTKNSNTIYANISNGMIVIKSDENDEKATARINKVGNKVYERFYRSIGGKITSIAVEENKFGETDIKIGLKNNDKFGLLTFKLDSSYGRSFLAQIFNADVTREIEFTPWAKVVEETRKTRLYLGYGERQNVEWKLPEGTPEVKWVKTKKGSVIDPVSKAECDDFLDEKLRQFIKDNNLEYTSIASPLTEEEKSHLRPPQSKTVKSNATITEVDFDDLFDI